MSQTDLQACASTVVTVRTIKRKITVFNVSEIVNRQCQLNKEERALEDDWNKLAEDFLNRPYVSEFLKMHNASILDFDYLDMQFDECTRKIDMFVWWRNCYGSEMICSIDPKDLDSFMSDDDYMIDLLKEKATEEEKQRAEKEAKKKAARYEMYKKLKKEFE